MKGRLNHRARRVLAAALVALGLPLQGAGQTPDLQQLWAIVQAQQAEIDALKAELAATRSQVSVTETVVASNTSLIETVADFVESPASGRASWASRTTVGGYGEMLYNHQTASRDSKELDIQRFVLFMNHQFNDRLRFVSELEIEHSYISDDDRSPGAVELEQAYLQWDYARDHSVMAGMYLAPIGLLNLTHEPDTFFGVERNQVESRIIPTTYRVNGINLSGRLAPGWSYDLGMHEGLFFESGNGSDMLIREARQNGARAEMDSLAYTGRLRYTGLPGLELGLSMQYQTDMTQERSVRSNIGRKGLFDVYGTPVGGISGLLSEAHLDYRKGGFGLRALYARWDINRRIESVASSGSLGSGLGRDEQYGFYLEPSYRFANGLGLFARYEEVDERAGSSLGAASDSAIRRALVGFNYWLTDTAVLKLDYQAERDQSPSDLDGFNLGVGWQF